VIQISTAVISDVLSAGLRPSVLGQDRSEAKNQSWSCTLHAVLLSRKFSVMKHKLVTLVVNRHNVLGGHNSFSSTIFIFSILSLEHHYFGDQQWRSLT